jgi:hypothetical protein
MNLLVALKARKTLVQHLLPAQQKPCSMEKASFTSYTRLKSSGLLRCVVWYVVWIAELLSSGSVSPRRKVVWTDWPFKWKHKYNDNKSQINGAYSALNVKGKVKQSHYRPWQTLRVPGGWGSQILRQSAHKGGKVSPTRWPPLLPGNIPGTHFC